MSTETKETIAQGVKNLFTQKQTMKIVICALAIPFGVVLVMSLSKQFTKEDFDPLFRLLNGHIRWVLVTYISGGAVLKAARSAFERLTKPGA